VNAWLTALVMSLTASDSVPVSDVCAGSARVIGPVKAPAMPLLVAISSPEPFVTVAPLVAVPSVTMRFVAAIATAGPEEIVVVSIEKLPVIVWLSRLIVVPMPSTRRYGPAGSETVFVFTVTLWAALVVLTSSV
jgi:hypothetical protein